MKLQPKKLYRFFLLMSFVCGYQNTNAQVNDDKLLTTKEEINLADSAEMYKTLLQNTPIETEFMYEPHFAIVGHNKNFYFSTGARLRFTTSFDWGNPVEHPNNMEVSRLEKADDGDESLFQMAAGTSQIYFNIIGFPHTQNQVGLFISLDLDANGNNSYHLKAGQIYMRYRNLQCGYAKSMYCDRNAQVFCINSARPCASNDHNSVQINYQRALTKNLSCGVGIEIPDVSYSQYIPCKAVNKQSGEDELVDAYQKKPDVPLYLNYTFGNSGHVRLSGVLRNISYHNYISQKTEYHLGWGLKLSGNYNTGAFEFYGTAQGGKGIANYITGNHGKGLDLVPDGDYETNGKLSATGTFGCIGAVKYNITPKVFTTGVFSTLRNYTSSFQNTKSVSFDNRMRSALTVNANIVWRLSDIFSTG
ncbi:MAG: hypothetical protein HUK05_03340, partial [Prevotella sp.]|nr:hypothetical protein [Prevotella sp.]